MEARKLLFLSLSTPDPQWLQALRRSGWDVRVAPSVEAVTPAHLRTGCLVGLVCLDDSWAPSQAERLPQLCPVEWIALVPQHLLRDSEWANVLANNFYDYHTLPPDIERLSVMLGHAHGRCELLRDLRTDGDRAGQFGMIGRSPPMQELFTRLARVTKVDAPILIQGESGTGKELVARAIHKHSDRSDGPFIAVNCGGLAEHLVQSELFGHERGSFTGAHQRKVGSFEAASGGTVFLDEIGDLPLSQQTNLLRFLQEKTITRVGATHATTIDARVLAATHVDLQEAVTRGRFREDLYYRLNVVRLEVPPLRQRGEDIELLAQALFDSLSAQKNPKVKGIGSSAFNAMRQHTWPGNVRELMNRMLQAMIMSNNRLLTAADLDLEERIESPNVVPLNSARQHFEREVIRKALENNRQNVSKTARDLGVSRVTLYRLFERFGIERP